MVPMFKRAQIVNGVAVFLIGSAIIWMIRRAASSSPGVQADPAASPGGDGPNFSPQNPASDEAIEV